MHNSIVAMAGRRYVLAAGAESELYQPIVDQIVLWRSQARIFEKNPEGMQLLPSPRFLEPE